ncbi:MAG: TonB-dependent receptor [Nevskia sp.]|nr:TonB-dependent receptor [Nevskia sp.]
MRTLRRRLHAGICGALPLLATVPALADAPATLDPVVVSATRTEKPAFEVPAQVDAAAPQDEHARLGVNLSEYLGAIAGLLIRDRQDYAQDQQLSVRGFGARAQFGIVGVRLYLDGIPATQPDGQSQASHFNLDSAERIEVLRGPFSTLYGNASGGVVQVFTGDGEGPAAVQVGALGGSYGTWRTSLNAAGAQGPVGYNFDYTHFATDGYRAHSSALRDSANAKLNFGLGGGNRLSLVANAFSSPESLDPMGLTVAQFRADPRQAAPAALQFDTRKSQEQVQAGLIDEQRLNDEQSLRLAVYYGHRIIKQYQSIPLATQAPATSPGGVIDLHNGYGGTDLRWTAHWRPLDRPLTLVAGVTYDDLDSHRRGYLNFVGSVLGVQGALRRDENDIVYNLDQYLQADWSLSRRWSVQAGVRHSAVDFRSADHYRSPGAPDTTTDYYATTPVAGVLYRASEKLHLYASYGEGFDTPTFDNIAYRPDGSPGLNLALQPARTGTGELGAKWKLAQASMVRVALFESQTRDEIVVANAAGGRSTYVNAGHTRRRGLESELDAALGGDWHAQLAYSYLDATYRADCGPTTCVGSKYPIVAGRRLPAVPESTLYGALRWGGELGFNAALEGSYLSPVPVNDGNSSNAPAYGLLACSGGYTWESRRWRLQAFARVDNLLDTRYVGAVVINDTNGQFYESGAGRSAYAGIRMRWRD